MAKKTPKKTPESVSLDVRKSQAESVIALMEEGKSERAACLEVGISRSTFRSAALRCQMADQYARALESLAHDQIELIEESLRDAREKTIDANIARLEVDTRKWLASKFLPKKYGDKIQTELTGADGGAVQFTNLTAETLDARIAELSAKLGNP